MIQIALLFNTVERVVCEFEFQNKSNIFCLYNSIFFNQDNDVIDAINFTDRNKFKLKKENKDVVNTLKGLSFKLINEIHPEIIDEEKIHIEILWNIEE